MIYGEPPQGSGGAVTKATLHVTNVISMRAMFLKECCYSFGGTVTLADVYLIPQVYNALRFNTPMAEFPKIQKIYDHCMTLPAFQRAAPGGIL